MSQSAVVHGRQQKTEIIETSQLNDKEPAPGIILGVRECCCGIQGPENLMLALTDRLARRGVQYVVANLWDGDPPEVALHQESLRRHSESHVVSMSFGKDPTAIAKMWALIRRVKPDVIHTHDPKSDFATFFPARMTRTPIVASYYGQTTISSRFWKLIDRSRFRSFRLFDRVLANSELQRAELNQFRVPPRLIELVPSFVDSEAIKPATAEERKSAREKLGIGSAQLVLATVAKLSKNKGHTYMLQALPSVRKEFSDVVYLAPGEGDLSWGGEGGLRSELKREANSLGVGSHTRFLGYYPDLKTILHASDLFVSPSLREGMQVALLEAMAAGLPIVGTNIGGTPDAVVDGETGLLVPPADPSALSSAIGSLLRDPPRLRRLGAAGRQRLVERFDAQKVADRFIEICRDVLSKRRR